MTGRGRRGAGLPRARGSSHQRHYGGLSEEAHGASFRPIRRAPDQTRCRPHAASLSKGRALLAVAAALLLIVTGCTDSGLLTRSSSRSSEQGSQPPASAEQLAAQKAAAGIADCPPSAEDVSAIAGGLPDVELPCLGGGPSVELAGLRGRPMMINVWAQWCGPCRQEAPFLADIAASTEPSEFMILGIDFDDPRPELAIEFAEQAEWEYPQMQDADAVLREELQISGPPQTFFVNAQGNITYRHAAPFTSTKQIRQLAEKYLGVQL
jgi:cytochrome c biogenesis protein CcmG, thiol:disulfide interchange protein DsbE